MKAVQGVVILSAVAVLGVSGAAGLGSASSAQAQAQNADRGATLFRQRCGSCHTVASDARSGMGPNLSGVFGRRAAAVAGYNYSNAMQNSGLTWTRENLDAYLAAPARTVRGTRMMTTVANAADRAEIIRYLERTG